MNWEDQPERILKITMSQRIAEIKRDCRKVPGQPCDSERMNLYSPEDSVEKRISGYAPNEKCLPDYMMSINQNTPM